MEGKNDLWVLRELNKGIKIGMDSITFVSDKVGDEVMKDNLSYQYKLYGEILDETSDLFSKYGEVPNDSDLGTKMMNWTGVQFNTITDKSNSHIAQLLIQGNTMGIIEGRKLLNQNPNADKDIKIVLDKFIKIQENNVEKLKTFL